MSFNLASRPFVNRVPVRRIAITLWVLVGLLVLLDGIFYLDYFRGSGRQARERSLELQSEIRAETARLEAFDTELGRFDPEGQAEHVVFLNERIAERTFGWSRLFDRLVDVLPLRVRLTQLQPRREDGRNRKSTVQDEVLLNLNGLAESGEALYQFLDQLYAHPAFYDPELSNEYQKDGTITFNLTVVYLPGAADPELAATDEGDEAAASQGGTPGQTEEPAVDGSEGASS
jgi:Tfp pilus assembly protein PilN